MRGKGLEEDAGPTSAGDSRGRRRVYFVRIDRTGNERVLLIDDEEALAKVGGIMLEHLGYRVTVKTAVLKPWRPSKRPRGNLTW